MALQYVGGVTGGRAGAVTTTSQSLSGTLAGGLASSPAAGDLVVVTISAASASGYAPTTLAVSGWTNKTFRANTGVANYSYQQISYKFMTSTPDTSITIPSSGNARNAQRWTVQVFRGVDSGTPEDVAIVYASGTATGRPDPGPITPSTAGAWILWTGASAAAAGTIFTAPSGFETNWLGDTTSDTYDVTQGAGYYTGWTSGVYNPAAITAGGTTGSTDSWVAETIVLRPAPPVTHATTGTLAGGNASVIGSAERPSARPVRISTTLWRQDTLGTSGSPGAKSITVPSDAQAVVVQFHSGEGGGNQALSITSNFAGTFTVIDSGEMNQCSVGYALVTSTGAKNLTLSWTQTLLAGPTVFISFINNINTSDWVREAAVAGSSANGSNNNIVLDSGTDDLLLVVNSNDDAVSSTISGFTSLGIADTAAYWNYARFQSCDSPGSPTTSVTGTSTAYDVISGISIKPDSGPVTHGTTGALTGANSIVVGSAKHNVPHASTAVLLGGGASVVGAAARAVEPDVRPVRISTTLWQQDLLGTGGTPGAKSITVPADAQAVVVQFHSGYGGTALTLSITSDFAGTFTVINSGEQNNCSLGYALVTSTGAKNLTLSWSAGLLEGPSVYISFIKNINTSDWVREAAVDGDSAGGTAASIVFDTSTDDLLLVVNDQDAGGGAPATISGFTSLATTDDTYGQPSRLQSCNAPGATTTTVTGTTTNFDVLSGISIKPNSGPVTHATTGTLTGENAAVVGSAAHIAIHGTTGTLSGAESAAAGSAARFRAHATDGTLTASPSAVAGASTRFRAHASTGALSASGPAVAGAANRFRAHTTSGVLTEAGSALASAANRFRAHATTGVLAGSSSTIAGTSQHNIPHTTTGALSGAGASVAGSANRFRAFATTGTLTASDASLAGTASRSAGPVTHDTTGSISSASTEITGTASRFRAFSTTGALSGSWSSIAGSSNRFRAHATTGALAGPGAQVAGAALRFHAFAATGALAGSGSAVVGSGRHNIPHATSGTLAGDGATAVGASARTRQHASTGTLAGGWAATAGAAQHNVPHATSGALAGAGATASGAASRNATIVTHASTGVLVADAGAISGSASRTRAHDTAGVLSGASVNVFGSSSRIRAHDVAGNLAGQNGFAVGNAARFRAMAASGTLAGAGAEVSGTAARNATHDAAGDLAADSASVAGASARVGAAVSHDTAGELYGPTSEISGNSRFGLPAWPIAADVKAGVVYGPTGTDYVGEFVCDEGASGGGGSSAAPIIVSSPPQVVEVIVEKIVERIVEVPASIFGLPAGEVPRLVTVDGVQVLESSLPVLAARDAAIADQSDEIARLLAEVEALSVLLMASMQ